jgi:hypothetical protein
MYYPKSQIRTGLYTQDPKFLAYADTQEVYQGFYWKTSQGKYYAGSGPEDMPNRELVLQGNQNTTALQQEPASFNTKLPTGVPAIDNNTSFSTQIIPIFGLTLPTADDYSLGYFNRYFCTKITESTYFEITQDTYKQLSNKNPKYLWEFYNQAEITWVLTGNIEEVFNKNKAQVQLASVMSNMPSLGEYFKNNYTKYYKKTV